MRRQLWHTFRASPTFRTSLWCCRAWLQRQARQRQHQQRNHQPELFAFFPALSRLIASFIEKQWSSFTMIWPQITKSSYNVFGLAWAGLRIYPVPWPVTWTDQQQPMCYIHVPCFNNQMCGCVVQERCHHEQILEQRSRNNRFFGSWYSACRKPALAS